MLQIVKNESYILESDDIKGAISSFLKPFYKE